MRNRTNRNQERGERAYGSGNDKIMETFKPCSGMNLCQFCGYRLKRGRCPAFGKICNVCHKQNHFAKVCKATTKEVHTVGNESARDEQPFFIGTF